MSENLDWLAGVESTPASFQPVKRGRQPGKNPMSKHVEASYVAKEARRLDVPASQAWRVERLLRRAAGKQYSISVQVQTAEGKVIPLKEVKDLSGTQDVTLVFEASDPKPKAEKPEAETKSEDATADPFAGTPSADAIPAEDETPANGKTRGRKPVTAK